MMDEQRLFMHGIAADACTAAADLMGQNRPLEALATFDRALDAIENCEPAIRGIMTIAERLTVSKHSPQLERLLGRCMRSPIGNPEALAPPLGRLLQLKYGLPSSPTSSADATVTDAGIQRLCNDVVLMAYLSATLNQHWNEFLTLVRQGAGTSVPRRQRFERLAQPSLGARRPSPQQ